MFILQQQAPTGPFGGSSSLIFMGLIMVVFWLFFIRPQAKKAKQQKEFINNLQKGDKVVTIAGIHGTIYKLNDDGTMSLEINPGSYIKMERSAISMEMTVQVNKAATAGTTDKK
ncbi:MAG TPA: preprotein translocase subunit YajC [Flavisolibacter sp.]|nr:preprotein translocase subunit YajC [Flavisolibacter sp.]